jgi:hypothetical protein
MAACAPVSEPIVAPLPQGAALDTAGRPYVRPAAPTAEYTAALTGGTRSTTGAPGPRYWQQRVRYDITAELDPEQRRVTASERIVYHNNSPRELPQVMFNLYQNLFTESLAGGGRNSPLNTGGFTLTAFSFNGETVPSLSRADYEANQLASRPSVGYLTTGTLSRVLLPRPIAPGDSAVFEISWSFRVPPSVAPRTGWEDALGGRVLQVAQWYPQIATYDDVAGYDVTPYSGQGEFYLEYGDFNVALTLPAGWTVGATGELQNPEILTPEVRRRLQAALTADSTVRVLPEPGGSGATGPGDNGRVTWRFSARDVRDFAFSTSNRYRWDARVADVPNTSGGGMRRVLVHSMYRPGAPHWQESAVFGDHATEFLSRTLVPYAYPQITVAEGPIYGMEYPMIVFIGRPAARLDLYEVIAHEIGHEWHPMMVGQDEAAHAWMDEGFTTFNEARAAADFFPDEDPWQEPRDVYLSISGNKGEAPLMRNIELVFGPANVVSAYYKPGTLLRSLQRALGDSVFFEGMRTYEREWMFKHPYPWDFFNTMERVAGRDLDWFWFPFFYRTVTLDHELANVTPSANGVQVTVRDVGQAPAPAEIVVTTSDGRRTVQTIPIEQWLNPSTRSVTVTVPVTGSVTRVELDPEQYFPDVNRRNNVWTP